ncbi:MAG: NADP-dependent malic enzyme [Bacillota bacterium]|nr:NADP-dependent malic enzyme [Bacillota bacterium]
MDYYEEALARHAKYRGKVEIACKMPLHDREDLSVAYTPGVAAPCRAIAADPEQVYAYTAKGNTVAVVSDGSAVLGLGNIGAKAALPVMEGKAVLFKAFGGVDAFPICLDTQDSEQIIAAVKHIAPVFGGINLEDICSPKCFEIERRLEQELDIPVFHDDQHGTAVIVAAALLNALRLTKRRLEDTRIVLNGPGSAGTAVLRMLHQLGARQLTACDEHGILHKQRDYGAETHKLALCDITNLDGRRGELADALRGADVFIGVSVANALTPAMIRNMAAQPVVFAMANPTPEIGYRQALEAGAAVVGTGRSDNPNQINNVLAFPGIFRGALDARARDINHAMKKAAAYAIANLVSDEELRADYILPDPFDKRVAAAVAEQVAQAARSSGVAGGGKCAK